MAKHEAADFNDTAKTTEKEILFSKKKSDSKVETLEVPRRPNRLQGREISINVIVDGHARELSPAAVTVAIQRGQAVEIPKGSKYTPPEDFKDKTNCKGCG